MQAVQAMCEKALLLEKGTAVSFVSVEEAAIQYLRSIETSSTRIWGKSRFVPGDQEVVAHIDHNDKIKCCLVEVKNANGEVTSNLSIDQPFFIDLTYEVIGELDCKAVPNIHFYDEFSARFFIALPENSCPNEKGVYTARCEIPPYVFNNGRYEAMIAISSLTLEAPLHFAYESAIRFEVTEHALSDPRRHGWKGALPGVSRPRLDWAYTKNNLTSISSPT
jgi:lipopolysaccharide transport system ATP-binding protein